jgi:hypothetical protein
MHAFYFQVHVMLAALQGHCMQSELRNALLWHAETGKPPSVPAVPGSLAAPVALSPKKRLKFRLAEKLALSHNVARFRFALPSPQHKFGLPVGKHVFLYAECAHGHPCRTPTFPAATRSAAFLLRARQLLFQAQQVLSKG